VVRPLICLVLLAFLRLSSSFADEDVKNPREGDPAAIAHGYDLFAARCSFCHGGHGMGAKGPALTAGHYKRGGSNLTLFSTIATGRPGTQMGAFGGRRAIRNKSPSVQAVHNRDRAAGDSSSALLPCIFA
jgi:mono/diheme cytochrome c family protein